MENETLTAQTTRSLYFRNTDPNHFGARLEAGTLVTVTTNRRGEFVAHCRLEGWSFGKRVVTMDDLDPNC